MYITGNIKRVFNIILDLGEDILEELQKIIDGQNIKTGIIAAGLGGFNNYALCFSSKDGDIKFGRRWNDMVLQLSSLQGFVENGIPHVHCSVSIDGEQAYTYTGHLDAGSTKFFYCQILLLEIDNSGSQTNDI